MDLKFTFGGGASPEKGDAPSSVSLPVRAAAPAGDGRLTARVRRSGDALVAEIVTVDGVVYTTAEVPAGAAADDAADPAALARPLRSVLARAVAALEGPVAESVAEVAIDLGGGEAAALAGLGIEADATGALAVDEALQRRVGITAGSPIRIGPAADGATGRG